MSWVMDLLRYFKVDVNMDPDATKGKGATSTAQTPFLGDDDDDSLWCRYQEFLQQGQQRKALYNVYDQMDTTDLVGGILDMYSEDATPLDPEHERTIWCESENRLIEEEINNRLLISALNIEEDITALARSIAKYGGAYDRTVYRAGSGILAAHPVHPRVMHRKEDKIHKLLGFLQDGKKFRNKRNQLSYPWDYIHYRLRGRKREGVYGASILFNMIRPWRQLIMAEDHSLLYQISRHPDRNLFMIDIGNMDELEAKKTLKAFKKAIRYTEFKDPTNRDFDTRFNPTTPLEDYVLGIREGSGTRIERMAGSANAKETQDLPYYISKMFSAARMPKRAFGFEDTGGEYNPKAAVTNQDIKYARNCRRLQRAVKHGVRTAACIHLLLKMRSMSDPTVRVEQWDFREKKNSFKIKMAPVSWLEELERLELTQLQFQVADSMIQSGRDHPAFNSRNWVSYILKTYMHMSDAVLNKVLVQKKKAQDREDAAFAPPEGEAGAGGGEGEGKEKEGFGFGGKERTSDSPGDWGLVDGNLSSEERTLLEQIVVKSPRLRRLIEMGQRIFALGNHANDDDNSYKDVPLPGDEGFDDAVFEDVVTDGDLEPEPVADEDEDKDK